MPVGDLVKMCFSGKYTQQEIYKKICGNGGFNAYLHTNDARVVEKLAKEGNAEASWCRTPSTTRSPRTPAPWPPCCAARWTDHPDGGIAYNPYTREILEKHLGFIAPITVYPGEDELLALCQGALRVVTGEEKAREY